METRKVIATKVKATVQQTPMKLLKQKRVIKPMDDNEIQVEMAKPTHVPYQTYTLNGKQYIGKEDGTLILKPRLYETKQLYEVLKDTLTTIFESPTEKIEICKVKKENQTFTRLIHWKLSNGKSVYKNQHTGKDRPQSIMNLPDGFHLVQEE